MAWGNNGKYSIGSEYTIFIIKFEKLRLQQYLVYFIILFHISSGLTLSL